MNLTDLIESEQIDEALSRQYRVSAKAQKLIEKLEKKEDELEDWLEKNSKTKPKNKIREIREQQFAIQKSLPVVERFQRYFKKLENALEGMPEQEKQIRIKRKYDEIKKLFFEELYHTMKSLSYNGTVVMASVISSLIIATIASLPIPGTTFLIVPSGLMLIKKLQEYKKKISDKNYEKEIDNLIDTLEKKKRRTLSSFGSRRQDSE